MADEEVEDTVKKRSPVLKWVLVGLLVLLLVGGAVAAALYYTGFFADTAESAGASQVQGSVQPSEQSPTKGQAATGPDGKPEEPKRVSKTTPELTRFEYRYLELERELLANLTGSRKVMQLQLAFMTRYDERVFNNVKKHEFALRSVALDLMRQTTEADLDKTDFRQKLAENIRESLNATLEKYEDFGGIEEVYFTTFVVQ